MTDDRKSANSRKSTGWLIAIALGIGLARVLCHIFQNDLYALEPRVFVLPGLLSLAHIGGLCWAIAYFLVQKRSHIGRAVTPLAIYGLAFLPIVFIDPVMVDFQLHLPERQALADDIMHGKRQPDHRGILSLTQADRVYAQRVLINRDREQTKIIFERYYLALMFPGPSSGYVYLSNDLVTQTAPVQEYTKSYPLEDISNLIERKLTNNWYWANWDN